MLRSLLSQLLARKPAASAEASHEVSTSDVEPARARLAARDYDGAVAAAAELLHANQENVDALVIQADALRRQGKHPAAMDLYRRALVLDPQRAEAWLDLGVCHYALGDNFWARVYFRLANTLQPDNADIWNELGLVEITLRNLEKAEESLENAVNRNPEHPEAWNNLGLVVARRGDLAMARRHFLRATFLRPDYYMAHCNLGLVCRDMEAPEDAEKALRAAAALAPGKPTAWLNLGMVLQDLGRFDDAEQALGRAHAADPGDPDVAAAQSALALRQGDARQAAALAEEALRAAPEHAELGVALAHAQLALRRFAEGWSNYEARLHTDGSPVSRLPYPLWQGEPLGGRTLLIQREQGLGDEIMFASCLKELFAAGGRHVLHCDKRLVPLFARSFPQAQVVGSLAGIDSSIDCTVAIGSLPRLYRARETDFAQPKPYLRASEQKRARWRAALDHLGPGLKAGLAWRGGLYRTGRVQRSLALDDLAPLLEVRGVQWVTLQRDATEAEVSEARERHGARLALWSQALADLDEMAAVIAELDVVITVCSTVVHLAGALGCTVWTLTPCAPAWRYFAEGASMPWYPDVTLVRQRTQGRWDDVVGELASMLAARACRS